MIKSIVIAILGVVGHLVFISGLGYEYDLDTSRELCVSQCTAICYDNQTLCEHGCRRSFKDSKWITNCDSLGCEGTCNFFRLINDSRYDLPAIPEIMTFVVGTNVFVSWTTSLSSTSVVYALQMKQDNNTWQTVRSKFTNTTYEADIVNICSQYQFRVMAINMQGAKEFSNVTMVADLQPGQLENVSYVGHGIYYYPMTGEFAGIVKIDLPPGWDDTDIERFEFDDATTMTCPSLTNVPKLQFSTLKPRNVTSHLQHGVGVKVYGNAFGCIFNARVRAVSVCGVNGKWTNFTVNLKDCQGVFSFPCSSIHVPFNPPGHVRNVVLRADLNYVEARLRINWSPPSYLSSYGYLDHYIMRYGRVTPPLDDWDQAQYLNDTKTRLNSKRIEFEIWVPKEQDTSYGFQIIPIAPHQFLKDNEWGLYQIFTVDIGRTGHGHPTGGPNDPDVRVIHVPNSLNISVIWQTSTQLGQDTSFFDHYVMQYGNVISSITHEDVLLNATTKKISPMRHFRNGTQNQYEVIIFDSSPVDLTCQEYGVWYGIQIRGVSLGDEYDDFDDVWENVTIYPFILNQSQVDRYPSFNKDSKGDLIKLAVVCASLAVAVISVFAVCAMYRNRKEKRFPRLIDRILDNSDNQSNLYNTVSRGPIQILRTRSYMPSVVPDVWEVPHSCVKVGKLLGQGAFGEVVKGRISKSILAHRNVKFPSVACGGCTHFSVAVKMLKEGAGASCREDFLREINLMKGIGYHNNVVCMLGCCTLQDPICLIVEHVPNGDLLTYLRRIRHMLQARESAEGHYENRGVDLLSPTDLLSFSRQIAFGMEFLSQKGFIHRDLAARNILVGLDKNVKIGDFGLTRFVYNDKIYVNRNGGKLPLKWMSIEAIYELTFSTASDIWSFGVVLFEIVTLGGTPYPTIDTRDLLTELKRGIRMDKPDNCSDQMYQVMRSCWLEKPRDRPSFTTLRITLENMLEADSGLDYLNFSLEGNALYYKVEFDTNSKFTKSEDIRHKRSDSKENNSVTSIVEYKAPLCRSFEKVNQSETIVCVAQIEHEKVGPDEIDTVDPYAESRYMTGMNIENKSKNANQATRNYSSDDTIFLNRETKSKTELNNPCALDDLSSSTDSESSVCSRHEEEFDADLSSIDTCSGRHTDSSSSGDNDDVFLADDDLTSHNHRTSVGARTRATKYCLRPYSREIWRGSLTNSNVHAPLENTISTLSEQNDSGVSTSSMHEMTMCNFKELKAADMHSRIWSVESTPAVRKTTSDTSSVEVCDNLSTYL